MASLTGLRRVNIPLLLEFKADLLLRLRAARLPIQVKYLVNRPQVVFGITMTVQAPTHRERLFLVNYVHVVHLAVATHTADAAIDVDGVIEIGKIRHLVDFHPVNRIPALPTLPHSGQFGIVGLNLRMAVHTGLRRRNIRVGRNLHIRVTITAIHPELCHMDIVRERHGLNRLVPRSHVFRRQIIPVKCGQCAP